MGIVVSCDMPPVDMAATSTPSTATNLGRHHCCPTTTGRRASSPRCFTPPHGYPSMRRGDNRA
eukprot:10389735-Prorocentrum_lima.AAC.1